MKKIFFLLIIIISTAVSVFIMVYYSSYINKVKYYEEDKSRKQAVVGYKKACIPRQVIINDNQGKVVKKVHEQTSNTKEHLANKGLSEKQKSDVNTTATSSSGDVEKSNDSKYVRNDKYLIKREYSLENGHYNTKEQEQSVFKVSTGKIEENLTSSDKMKLLYVSCKLGKENFKKVEEYLYAVDSEEGVLKALKLLKKDLSKKEYEKVRKIAGKFINMDAAERLK